MFAIAFLRSLTPVAHVAVTVSLLVAMSLNAPAQGESTTTSEAIWAAYAADPHDHPHVPNNSYAGYRQGVVAIPDVPVVADVADFGAIADDGGLDDRAFRDAIESAWLAGGGAVQIPPGRFRFENPIWLWHSGVVLRGSGRGETILEFTRPLVESVGQANPNGTNIWSWTGGLIWVSPRDAAVFADPDDPTTLRVDPRHGGQDYQHGGSGWEYWREGDEITKVEGEHPRGSSTLTVADASRLRPGQLVLMTYKNIDDAALWKHIAQHPLFHDWDGWGQGFGPDRYPRWQWPVEIASIEGNTVTLAQPLRVAILPDFSVALRELGPYIREVGVESLSVQLHGTDDGRTYDLGWNGVFLNRVHNGWVRDVETLNANDGFNVSACKNVSLLDTRVAGDNFHHHPYTNRGMSHDCLYQDFEIDISEDRRGGTHGINTEQLSTGNVWSRGTMNRGTLDTHRAMPFDAIRTEITLRNEKNSNPGGSKKAGPYALRRVVHWNIKVENTDRPADEAGLYVNQPENHTFGALVGIRGAAISDAASWEDSRGGVMPVGDKDVLIADPGEVPSPKNLHDAQLDLRRETHKWALLASPNTGFAPAGEPVTLRAAVEAAGADVQRVTFLVDGREVGATDREPYEITFRPTPGRHDVEVVVRDASGATTRSPHPVPLTVGTIRVLEEDDPALERQGEWKREDMKGEQWYGGGAASAAPGDEMQLTFTGTRILLVTDANKRYDSNFSVEIDGERVINARDIRGRGGVRQVEYDSGWLDDGEHTVRFIADKTLIVDRVIVYSTVPQ